MSFVHSSPNELTLEKVHLPGLAILCHSAAERVRVGICPAGKRMDNAQHLLLIKDYTVSLGQNRHEVRVRNPYDFFSIPSTHECTHHVSFNRHRPKQGNLGYLVSAP